MREHEFEPIRGLPGDLPEGEVILWQGAPRWLLMACQAFHLRAVGAYFAVMLVWRAGAAIAHGEAAQAALGSALAVTPLAAAGLGILALLGWLNSRTTVYTITNKRVVLRFGTAIPKAINLPFGIIESAAVKTYAGEAGDLALTLKAPNKLALLQLWPHARPWRMATPQPTLRAVPDVAAVGAILASAMQKEVAIALTPAAAAPVRARPAPSSGGLAGPETATA